MTKLFLFFKITSNNFVKIIIEEEKKKNERGSHSAQTKEEEKKALNMSLKTEEETHKRRLGDYQKI